MRMIARIRTVVEVPFDYDVQPPDENGNSAGSAEAAEYAETVVVQQVKDALTSPVAMPVGGTVLDELVEEVREATP